MERRELLAVDGADGGAELEEAVEQREEGVAALAVLHRRVQRRAPRVVGVVDVGARVEQLHAHSYLSFDTAR